MEKQGPKESPEKPQGQNFSQISLSKTESQKNEWKAFKTLQHPENMTKSLPNMSEEHIMLHLVEINLIAYYNQEVLDILNEKMKKTSFYLKNRYILQNVINIYKDEKLRERVREISNKFDETYVNGCGQMGIQLAEQMSSLNLEEGSTEKSLEKITKKMTLENRMKEYRAKFISKRNEFIQEVHSISEALFSLGKENKKMPDNELTDKKQELFMDSLLLLNDKIAKQPEIKSTTSSESDNSISDPQNSLLVPSQNQSNLLKETEINFKKTRGYKFYFRSQYHEVDEIYLESSKFIKTKNRNPLVLDFGFGRFIYKDDDQLSHEIIAMELMKYLNQIFGEQLILEYEIIPEIKGALYEFVERSVTVDWVKKEQGTLAKYFDYLAKKKVEQSELSTQEVQIRENGLAQELTVKKIEEEKKKILQKFAKSYAGYAMAEFLLELKDRNNANIMIRDDGSIFHIDLAFLFDAKPGGINFESAPFKMTKQYVKAMGGFDSDIFKLFETKLIELVVKVFESRDELLWKIKVLSARSREIKCFKGFDFDKYCNSKFISSLAHAKEFVESLIDKSYDSWNTKKYDSYQKKTNGIEC